MSMYVSASNFRVQWPSSVGKAGSIKQTVVLGCKGTNLKLSACLYAHNDPSAHFHLSAVTRSKFVCPRSCVRDANVCLSTVFTCPRADVVESC
ncbi:hypothetical protein BaRGS_00010921 [Batillaria attramentaria]|uniref:Uncharacterized protein n=1 Tax=Batillaria attramentaria TaxID=370345 RepID=A0ABD0LFF5_9CAEN